MIEKVNETEGGLGYGVLLEWNLFKKLENPTLSTTDTLLPRFKFEIAFQLSYRNECSRG